MRTVLLILASLLLLPTHVTAQLVEGSVTEEGSLAPVEGAMVVVMEEGGEAVTRVLTDAAGAFSARVPHPGYYRIRVDRIGYASLTTDRFPVPPEGTEREIFMPVRAVELKGLDVEGSRRCEVRPEEGRVTARVWEEARKALAATAWTQSQGIYRYTLLHFTRSLTPAGGILDESRSFRRGRYQAPFASLPGEDLVEGGFIRPDSADEHSTIYYAPDAEALLSNPFLDTHCMAVRRGDGGLLGLEFEPVEGRELPEIRGVLWIDAATARLRRLEFTYVNLARRELGAPGGQVVFGGLPNGTWIVREWRIRMPRMGYDSRTGYLSRVGYREEGGVVWRVSDRHGAILLEAGTATLAGSVVDSLGRNPLPDAVVRVEGTGEQTRTEEDGSFILPGVAEGLHRLRVLHPALDTLGLTPPPVRVEATLGEMTSTRIIVPGVADALAGACGGAVDPDKAILFGRVLGSDGGPGGAVAVRVVLPRGLIQEFPVLSLAVPPGPDTRGGARWRQDPDADHRIETETDRRGIFMLCNVPEGSRLRVEVTSSAGRSVRETTGIPRGARVATVKIFLDGG